MTVFISYSHDSEAHRQRVALLVEQIKLRGIRVVIDLDCPDPSAGFIRWMEEQFEAADRILMVFTETYRRRYEGKEIPGVGRGVAFEAHLIRTLLHKTVPDNMRIRAVTMTDGDERHIPLLLQSYRRYRVDDEAEIDELCHWVLSPDESVSANQTHGKLAMAVETQAFSPFQTGGTLPDGHQTYVRRDCDRQLAEYLDDPRSACNAINGDYEIGKSSLMNRAARVLGREWIAVGGSLGVLRTDKTEGSVDRFFKFFVGVFGQIDSWEELRRRLVDQPVLLRLDELWDMLEPGAQAILPSVIDTALDTNAKLRVVATLAVGIEQYLHARHLEHPRFYRPWRTVTVRPFDELQAESLLSLLPTDVRAIAERRFPEVARYSALKPRSLQLLADRLWRAHRNKETEARVVAIVQNPASYLPAS